MRYFFDLPVYRLPEERYYTERNRHVEREVSEVPISSNQNAYRAHCIERYGGPWQFNEIVGYVRLYFDGSQVLGEYWRTRRKRLVRTRKKVFWCVGHKVAPEVDIPINPSSADVEAAVNEYVERARSELKGRHIDTAGLERLGRFLDWASLYSDVEHSIQAPTSCDE